MSTDEWTALGTWAGALGTTGAFLIAAVIYLQSERARVRSQARLVSINQTSTIDKLPDGAGFQPRTDAAMYVHSFHATPARKGWRAVGDVIWVEVTLRNASDETLADVRMAGSIQPEGVPVSLPRVTDCPPDHVFPFDIVVPDPDRTYLRHVLTLRAEFTDGAGKMWRRESGRPLRRIHRYSIPVQTDEQARDQSRPAPEDCPICGAPTHEIDQEGQSSARVWCCTDATCPWTVMRLR